MKWIMDKWNQQFARATNDTEVAMHFMDAMVKVMCSCATSLNSIDLHLEGIKNQLSNQTDLMMQKGG